MSRIADAKEALAVQRKADAVVSKMLDMLAGQDEEVAKQALATLIELCHDVRNDICGLDIPKMPAPAVAPPKVNLVAVISELPGPVQKGATEWKRLSGLPESKICETVCQWIANRSVSDVAIAFSEMKEERPAHELSFLQARLGA